jgi:acetyl-CoA acetyltransferase family protein
MSAERGELQTVVAARRLRDAGSVFIGVGRPSTAAILASMVHNPDLVLVYESGTIGARPTRIPLSIGDGELAETATAVVSVPEMFNYWIGPGRIEVAFLGAAQVDRHGNLNSTVIGDYERPGTRLPGAGGAPEIALGCPETVVIAPHSRRTFVERVDFVTTVARGAAAITDLGVLESDPGAGELTLTQVHEGVTVGEVRAATGWELRVADDVAVSSEAYIYEAVRTPFGRYGGALAGVRPDDLAAHAISALMDRAPGLDPAQIDDVVLGNANGAGEDNRDIARMAALLAGLPTSVPGVTVNRLCGSSLEAAMQASRLVESGDASVVIAGGVESMSRAPWVMLKPDKGFPAGHETLHSTTLGWRMVNPKMPEQWTISLGASAEKLAEMYDISRAEQDAFAVRSHRRAAEAWDEGVLQEVVPVPGVALERDEGIRADTDTDKLAALKPAFVEGGTVTAGNSSPLNDGAAMLLLGDAAAGERFGTPPLARVVARAAHAVDPDVFGIGPVEAARKALARAGATWDDVDVVELNEAFASQSLACLRGWPELDPEKVNPRGGAIAIGHPLGASGARVLGRLAHELHGRGGGLGVATLCIGVGQGLAVVLEGCG